MKSYVFSVYLFNSSFFLNRTRLFTQKTDFQCWDEKTLIWGFCLFNSSFFLNRTRLFIQINRLPCSFQISKHKIKNGWIWIFQRFLFQIKLQCLICYYFISEISVHKTKKSKSVTNAYFVKSDKIRWIIRCTLYEKRLVKGLIHIFTHEDTISLYVYVLFCNINLKI